jgi:hypothetical protein
MKGKRYTMEDKIRILREADRGGKSIIECLQGFRLNPLHQECHKSHFTHISLNLRNMVSS